MGRFDDAPDVYWHCYFGSDPQQPRTYAMVYDLTKQQLLDQVITPWRARQPLLVGSQVVRDHDAMKAMKIVQTDQPSKVYEEARSRRLGEAGMLASALVAIGPAAFHEGVDFTHELLASTLAAKAPSANVATLLQVCARLQQAAKPLEHRRQGKTQFTISDEYDVQDLLHSLVRAYFKFVVSEEPIKKLANAKATRADFSVEALGTIVEVKYVHGPNDQARIVQELGEDLLFYEQWEHLKVLIYVVYNASDLRDPEALDALSCMRSSGGKQYEVYVVRA
jgi:hypothetical protein